MGPRERHRHERPAAFQPGRHFETSERSGTVSHVNLPEDRKHLSRKSFAIYLYTRTVRPTKRPLPLDDLHPAVCWTTSQPGDPVTEEQWNL